MATFAQLLAAGVKWINASNKAHAIVNGPATGVGSSVTVESGDIPTFAKQAAENAGINTILRTAAQGAPSFYGRITIAGGAPSTANGVYEYAGMQAGKPSYVLGSNYLGWNPSSGGYWALSPGPLSGGWAARSNSQVTTPDLATGWFRTDTSAAVPGLSVVADRVIPTAIGQLCRVGDAAPYTWYRADTMTSWAVDAGASNTAFTPAGSLSATNVQAALVELDAEKMPATVQAVSINKGDTTEFGGFSFSLTTPQDPGTPLAIEGRGSFVHGLSVTSGSGNFTNGSDHAHFVQGCQYGQLWQRINGGGSYGAPNAKSRLMTHTQAPGIATTAYNTANLVSLDSRSISPATPVSPDWSGDNIILNYSANVALTLGQRIQVVISPGLSGFVGGRYPGTVTQIPTLVGGVYEVRVKLWFLTAFNFTVADKSTQDVPLNAAGVKTVALSTYPAAIANGTLLERVPTLGRNRFRSSFSTAHGLTKGQAVVCEILEAGLLGKVVGVYDAYVLKVESSTSVICSMGSMIADYNYQPDLTGAARNSGVGWSLMPGNTDPIHQPVASLQSYLFEREPNNGVSDGTFAKVRLFNVGPGNECYENNSFSVGFYNTVLGAGCAAIGENLVVNGSSTIIIGRDINWNSFLDNGAVVGSSGGQIYVGVWGLLYSQDGGTTYKNILQSSNLINFGGNFTTTGAANATLAMPATGAPVYTLPATTATLARTDAGQTFAGAQAFSSTTRPTSAGTGTPATNSLVTLADADNSAFERLGQLFFPRKTPGLSSSGGNAFSTAGGNGTLAALCLGSGAASAANAWSCAIIQDGLNSNPDFTGQGIYGIPATVAVSLMSNMSTANQVIRILLGTTGSTPATSGNNAFAAKGFGMEIVSTSSSTSIRAIAHDGTTYYGSATLVQIHNSPLWDVYRVFEVKSDAAGNITAVCRIGRTILGTSSISTGPTGTLGGRYVEANISTNTTAAGADTTLVVQDWAIKLY